MYKLWCLLIYGYVPQWEIIDQGIINNDKGDKIGRYFILQCEHSGKIKIKNVFA